MMRRTAMMLIATIAPFPAHAAVDCPASAQRHGLIAFSLLEEATAAMADYAPDTSRRGGDGTFTNTWRLAPAARLVAICRYGGGVEQRIRLPVGLRQCQSIGMPGQLRVRCD